MNYLDHGRMSSRFPCYRRRHQWRRHHTLELRWIQLRPTPEKALGESARMMWPWFFLMGLSGITLLVIPLTNLDVLSKRMLRRLSKFTNMPDYIFSIPDGDVELDVDEYIENTQVSLLSYVIAVIMIFLVLFMLYSIIAFDGLTIAATGATPVRIVIEAWLQAGLIFLLTGVGIQDIHSRLIYSGVVFVWTLIRIGSPLANTGEAPRIFFTVLAELRIFYIIYVMAHNSPRENLAKFRIRVGKSDIDGTFNALGTYGLTCALIMAYLLIGDLVDIIGINGPVQLTQVMPPVENTRIAEAIVLGLNDFWILVVVPLVVSDRYRFLNYEGMFAKIEQNSGPKVKGRVGEASSWYSAPRMPLYL